ncbi:MAG: FAD-dependent oxidoreductase, partial [Bacteroidota bacterium]
VIYGVWNYNKNSGEFEEVDQLTLEWVATIPGKRESRRFEGHYMLKQQDVIGQRSFEDAVAFGGWALDLHPADGVYSERSGCTQWHAKGIYDLPYRCYVSKDIDNLFLAGRIISATHVAFGSSRVMATCGAGGQAVGMAAAICTQQKLRPADLITREPLVHLQNELNLIGQSIPGIPIQASSNLLTQARVQASSSLRLSNIPFDGAWLSLKTSAAQLLPMKAGQSYTVTVKLMAEEHTSLEVQLRTSCKPQNYTPEVIIESHSYSLEPGEQELTIHFSEGLPHDQYGFVTFLSNGKVAIQESNWRYTGVLSVFNGVNKAVSNDGSQRPPDGIGIDAFEFWIPNRRPAGKNLAMTISPAIQAFEVENLGNGYVRPWLSANAFIADPHDPAPKLTIEWEQARLISELRLFFDTDYDHAMESTLMGHPEDVMPFCVRNYRIHDLEGKLLVEVKGNYQTIRRHYLESGTTVKGLIISLDHPGRHVPASLFEIIIQ